MHPFDRLTLDTLRARSCLKWTHYSALHPERDVLPLWVADMDFPPAQAVIEALVARARSGNLGYPAGYPDGEPGLQEAVASWLYARHGWKVAADDIWPLHGVIPGLYLGVRALASAGEGVVLQSPLYPPFMAAVADTGREAQYNPLVWTGDRWTFDLEGLERTIRPHTRALVLCNPHNPTGRVFSREELLALAEVVLRHRLWVIADELHSDLVYPGAQHVPFAALGDEVAERTVTLLGPTKGFNLAGLKVGFAIVPNAALRRRLAHLGAGLVTPPNVMAQAAAQAAYTRGAGWLQDTLAYMQRNRDLVTDFAKAYLPGGAYAPPEGTYLAWLDLRPLGLGEALYDRLLECGVGLSEGRHNGPGGEGFVRLNFATSRAILQEALERLQGGLGLG
jgi:cystathionine beta-lyase